MPIMVSCDQCGRNNANFTYKRCSGCSRVVCSDCASSAGASLGGESASTILGAMGKGMLGGMAGACPWCKDFTLQTIPR